MVGEISELKTSEEIAEKLTTIATKAYEDKEKALGASQMRLLERLVTLSTIDEKWMDHLDAMETLREGIWLRGDKRTVLSEYKKEAFGLFEQLVSTIEATVAKRIYRAHLQQVQQEQQQPIQMTMQKDTIHESLTKEIADASVPEPAQLTSAKGGTSDLAAALKNAHAKPKAQPGVARGKINRNDPCPCGSGLKYKKCGLINAPEHRG